jgi:hypothetical protein
VWVKPLPGCSCTVGCPAASASTHAVLPRYDRLVSGKILKLNGTHDVRFDVAKDLVGLVVQSKRQAFYRAHTLTLPSQAWNMACLPAHPNGIRLSVFDAEGDMLRTQAYYS